MTLLQLLYLPFSFLCGALPLAVWTGLQAGHDIRQVGDGNPGATNVLRAAGLGWGIVAYGLEFSKAAAPVGLARYILQWSDWVLVPIALAPALGHAFNPFLGGRGGKALATILGSWIGLTLYEMPLVLLVPLVFFFLLLDNDGWSVLITGLVGLGYLLLFKSQPAFVTVLVLQLVLVIWTHYQDLSSLPHIRARWLGKQ